MKLFSRNSRILLAAASCLVVSGAALAQQAPAQPETKTIGDWTVRCFPIQSPSPCDVWQEQAVKNTGQRVLSLSIAFVPSLNKYAIQISVPLDISIQKGVVLQTDAYTSPVFKYRRCDRSGCYVEMPVDNAVVEGLSRSGAKGKVNIVADNGKKFGIDFSLKGFAQAHDDMVAQARAKAKPVQQTAAAPAAPATAP
jgi:invasion protein IalB